MPRIHSILGTVLCLALILSCQEKKDEPVVPPYKDTVYPTQVLITQDQMFPELEQSPSILYNEELGYYITLGEKEWSQEWSSDPVSIPAQSRSVNLNAIWFEADEGTAWEICDTWDIVLEDIPDNLSWGECPTTFKMTLSLGEEAPYRKVTVHDMILTFPSAIRAHALVGDYFLPDLEVTAEGTEVTFELEALGLSDQLFEKDGKRCCSFPTDVWAQVNVSPEDAVEPGMEEPATLPFRLAFEFDQIDFTKCHLTFPGLSFPEEELVWDPVRLPSFLCGEGTDVSLRYFRILFKYRNDIPLVSRLDAMVRSEDRKASFSAEGENINYMFLAYLASNYHEGYFNVPASAFDGLFRSPFPGGAVQPSLLLKPVYEASGFVVAGQDYSMGVQAEMVLPLAFDGKIDVGSFTTAPVVMEGYKLEARGNYRQRFQLILGNGLPFDSLVQPVFTIEGEEPIYGDVFPMDMSNRQLGLIHEFVPATDDWTATIHFIVTPLKGWNEPIFKGGRMDIQKFIFSANLPEEE